MGFVTQVAITYGIRVLCRDHVLKYIMQYILQYMHKSSAGWLSGACPAISAQMVQDPCRDAGRSHACSWQGYQWS
jgi:hypothetical protein